MGLHQKRMFPLISAFVDGELREDDRRRLEEHIGSCEDCRKTLEDFRLFKDMGLRAKPFPITPYYLTRIRAAIEKGPAAPWGALEIEAKLFAPLLTILVLALIILFSVTESEKVFTSDEYLFGGRKTLVEQQLLSRPGKVSNEEVLLLTVSTQKGEEPNGR